MEKKYYFTYLKNIFHNGRYEIAQRSLIWQPFMFYHTGGHLDI